MPSLSHASLSLAASVRKGDLVNVLCGPMAGNVELVTADPISSRVSSPLFGFNGETVRISTENGTVNHYHLCVDAISVRAWMA